MNQGMFSEQQGELRGLATKLDRVVDLLTQIASQGAQQQATTERSTEVALPKSVYPTTTEIDQWKEHTMAKKKTEDTQPESPVEKTENTPGKPAVEVVDEVLTPDKPTTTTINKEKPSKWKPQLR